MRELIRGESTVTLSFLTHSNVKTSEGDSKRTFARLGITCKSTDFILKFKSDARVEIGTGGVSYGYYQSKTQKHFWTSFRMYTEVQQGRGHLMKTVSSWCLLETVSEGKA